MRDFSNAGKERTAGLPFHTAGGEVRGSGGGDEGAGARVHAEIAGLLREELRLRDSKGAAPSVGSSPSGMGTDCQPVVSGML